MAFKVQSSGHSIVRKENDFFLRAQLGAHRLLLIFNYFKYYLIV
jgi:hypothetical protein